MTGLDLPVAGVLRLPGAYMGGVEVMVLRVVDGDTVEVVRKDTSETLQATWVPGYEAYEWRGRELWVSSSGHKLHNQKVPRLAAMPKNSIEHFLQWCAENGFYLGHMGKDPAYPDRQRFYPLNELITGTESDLLQRYRSSRNK